MRFLFISNYINHHQIPFCNTMYERLGEGNFAFIQTQPMEEERVRMGWDINISEIPYVYLYDNNTDFTMKAIAEYDIVLLGWTENLAVREACLDRAESGRPLLRMSERIYREGQWKAISPRGLIDKYKEHIRFRAKEVYMLCNGAYVASDFALIHAYPQKMFRWGYFPELRTYTEPQMRQMKRVDDKDTTRILWAGRFMRDVKHPEFALELAKSLKENACAFHLDLVGDGEMMDELRAYAQENRLADVVTFHGFHSPELVRQMMEDAHVYLFTSNHLEGWGAVVNEAMNSGCAVVAGAEAGAVPFLIRNGENGYIFDGENVEDFIKKVTDLLKHPGKQRRMGNAAYETIQKEWNSNVAAERLIAFSKCILEHREYEAPESGPLSKAAVIKPFLHP